LTTKTIFFAFAGIDPLISSTIVSACKKASSADTEFVPWKVRDLSGQPIDRGVANWVEEADAVFADISFVNHNVTFEIAYAIALGKPVYLVRYSASNWSDVEAVGLLHNVGHSAYADEKSLVQILENAEAKAAGWPRPKKNYAQPLYFVQPSSNEDSLINLSSAIKKRARLRFRTFNPKEVDRLTASEAHSQVAASFGVIATWHSEHVPHANRQNQRAAFVIGLARGFDIPFRLIAANHLRLPLDIDEISTRISENSDIGSLVMSLKEEIDTSSLEYAAFEPAPAGLLSQVYCGDPAAENEMGVLSDYFLETEEYAATIRGDVNVLSGRKGSGKTAVFIRSRDRIRSDKNNIVVDLQPEGYQLLKLKEFALSSLSPGTRKEFLATFWEYIFWLEIAYKVLEKDKMRASRDSALLERYERLETLFNARVDTGSGDFSERLRRLTDRIVDRFKEKVGSDVSVLDSSQTLSIVYGSEIGPIRAEIFSYLKLKGTVAFLFDNIDRIWSPGGFTADDAAIIVGLIESLQEISRRFTKQAIPFQWAVFIRSDIQEFVVAQMADYGKLATRSVEWSDRDLLWRMFTRRLMNEVDDRTLSVEAVWSSISVGRVQGKTARDFLLDSSLMRPRYLIRLFETARQRALAFDREQIDETDYEAGLEELGWQVLEDFDRELADIVPDAQDLLFQLSGFGESITLETLKEAVLNKVVKPELVDPTIDVLIWTGCIGVKNSRGSTFISEAGFKRPFMRALMARESGKAIVFHPTLAAVLAD
jgi:hypothetical protein